jgi:hypothetical protein
MYSNGCTLVYRLHDSYIDYSSIFSLACEHGKCRSFVNNLPLFSSDKVKLHQYSHFDLHGRVYIKTI